MTSDSSSLRVRLLDSLTRLLPSQFEELLFRLGVPTHHLPGQAVAMSARAIAALQYLEARNELDRLKDQLSRMLPQSASLRAPSPPATHSTQPGPDAEGLRQAPIEIVIMTALRIEYQEAAAHLTHRDETELATGTVVEVGSFRANSRTVKVAVLEAGAGNNATAAMAQEAISSFNPVLMLFIGVAGGVKDVRLGDVVAATKVYGYESGKAEEQFLPRPDVGQSSYRYLQRARAEARKIDWLRRAGISEGAKPPDVFVGAIAAGGAVVASTKSAHYQFLQRFYGDTLAVEMEGRGFLDATHRNRCEALIVRGISDLIDGKAAADGDSWQPRAAKHAAAFAFEVIAKSF